jgi:hypothetical protein
MSKKVMMKMPPNMPKPVDPAEAWVANRDSATVTTLIQPVEKTKRFTIDVSESLHKRIKVECAARGTKMADVIRDLLEQEFPGSKGQGA